MKRSLLLAAAALAAVTIVAAGCGGSDEVPADAVAVVDGTTISRASLDDLLARAKKSYTAQKRTFPKAGTSEYQSLQTQAVAYLVQRQEYAQEAEKLGIQVTDGQITKKLEEVKKQYFAGNQAKFEKGLKDQGYTVDTLRDDIRSQLVTEGIYKKVTNDVKVTDADLTKAQLKRLAVAAQDGMARAVSPSHSLVDGDIVFAASSGARPVIDPIFDTIALGHAAAICLARAIARAIYLATPADGDLFPTWQQKFGR